MKDARIALDVMGGDKAPDAILRGALTAVAPSGKWKMSPQRILLVGDEATIRSKLEEFGGDPGFAIQHASQVIGMGESPEVALRAKRDSSIAVMIGATKMGAAGAAVSMGNTGAVVGAATLGLGTLPGVLRPGIAVTVELTGAPLTFIDMGALVSPKPEHLYQFGVMGSVFSHDVLGQKTPRVGLLNIGEEEGKGTDTHKAAWKLLKESNLEFVGNLEGNDLFQNRAEVVVTDGFTGNVVLKLLEEFAGFMLKMTVGEVAAQGIQVPAAALARVKKRIDYSEYGGALLLGVNGVVIIGHGRSDENAVANALSLGARALDADVNAHIVSGLQKAGAGGSVR
ncbi:MAG: phosphate acyltransferase PlsX [Planctomycetota bacterium]|nr:phosphate acyltransferase PlsX [Planctomycetota bacterium]